MVKLSEAPVGAVFGRLTVISLGRKKVGTTSQLTAICECSCGSKPKEYHLSNLGPRTTSCGCAGKEARRAGTTTHGLSKTRTYQIWCDMWKRTTNPSSPAYLKYKDRTPPAEWADFAVFLNHMGEAPEGLTLERIRNDEPYGPGNCKWATRAEQSRNRAVNVYVLHKGEKLCFEDAAKASGVNSAKARARIERLGWSISKALESPDFSWPDGVNPWQYPKALYG